MIDASGPCLQKPAAARWLPPTHTFTVTLHASCTIAVGNTVQVDFTFNPTVTGTTTFTVTTTNNGTASSAADLTVNSTPPDFVRLVADHGLQRGLHDHQYWRHRGKRR